MMKITKQGAILLPSSCWHFPIKYINMNTTSYVQDLPDKLTTTKNRPLREKETN